MPTSKTSKDPAEEAAAENPQTHTTTPGQEAPTVGADGAGTRPEPGVYEYTHGTDCVYPHVPLTARAANPGRPESEGDPGEATVFNWPFGPPDDGRWTTTRKKPNQAADNDPAPSSEE